jgi:hypothetical protein
MCQQQEAAHGSAVGIAAKALHIFTRGIATWFLVKKTRGTPDAPAHEIHRGETTTMNLETAVLGPTDLRPH